MARDDWFRNTEWNNAIEEAFFAKLRRARDKAQYLRIQACTIAKSHPEVALRLLDQYFNLGQHFDRAQAHVDRASAYLSLGDIEAAFKAYESALAIEEQFPSLQTNAYLELPFLVACSGTSGRYEQAMNLLRHHKSRLTFPIDHFRWHASQALILSELNQAPTARIHARQALQAASEDHSGFRYHRGIGLVREQHEDLRSRLCKLAD
jgi:tetratricopeptide (TPR) repeat protein